MIRGKNADLKGQKSMEDVVNELSLLHPEYAEELKMLLDAYEMPFARFCANEADFRLREYYEVDDTAEGYQELVGQIAGELFASEYYLDCDTADQIIEDALKEYTVTVSKMDDICYFVEGKNILFYANKSDYEVITRILCKIHHQDSLQLYDMILVMLKKEGSRILSYKELEKIYQDCLRRYQIECQEVL
ncbi:MAG: hypothetical protein E6686_10165 [Lachnospiraceae bacterium]|nr:hypothetical protein [Lachnospiraceae bacterium]